MNFNGIYTHNNKILVSRYQTSGEIAGAILKAIKESKETANKLAPYFKGNTKKESCKLIFSFLKKVVPYVKESSDNQTAKTINRILKDANQYGGDCKHYATFSASICKALNIPCKLRLISQKFNDTTPNHIYTVAVINGNDIIIDPVLNTFDNEARYNYKYDINI
jgi:hypothetical protein